jgi:hypothetical protein
VIDTRLTGDHGTIEQDCRDGRRIAGQRVIGAIKESSSIDFRRSRRSYIMTAGMVAKVLGWYGMDSMETEDGRADVPTQQGRKGGGNLQDINK